MVHGITGRVDRRGEWLGAPKGGAPRRTPPLRNRPLRARDVMTASGIEPVRREGNQRGGRLPTAAPPLWQLGRSMQNAGADWRASCRG
jgi:hypothetical protein